MQVTLAPYPKNFSSLPYLWLVQAGTKGTHSQRVPVSSRVCLPITPAILCCIREEWQSRVQGHDIIMLWAIVCLCFFGFLGNYYPLKEGFDCHSFELGGCCSGQHSSSLGSANYLEAFKCAQLGQGVKVYVGWTGSEVCPVAALLLAYMYTQ